MSWKWGRNSLVRIRTCHPDLQSFLMAIEGKTPLELTVVWGYRNKEQQNAAYDKGASKLRYPKSKHNHTDEHGPCSLAVDIAPYVHGIPWKDGPIHHQMVGMVLQLAEQHGLNLRNGSDWDGDWSTLDTRLMDPDHFELKSV